MSDKPYTVFIDDNFHYMDEDHRTGGYGFDTWEEAAAWCARFVEEEVEQFIANSKTADEAWQGYTGFGEDPFIRPEPEGKHFSAWDYAKAIIFERFGRVA